MRSEQRPPSCRITLLSALAKAYKPHRQRGPDANPVLCFFYGERELSQLAARRDPERRGISENLPFFPPAADCDNPRAAKDGVFFQRCLPAPAPLNYPP